VSEDAKFRALAEAVVLYVLTLCVRVPVSDRRGLRGAECVRCMLCVAAVVRLPV
jgi:hypothetical protein